MSPIFIVQLGPCLLAATELQLEHLSSSRQTQSCMWCLYILPDFNTAMAEAAYNQKGGPNVCQALVRAFMLCD